MNRKRIGLSAILALSLISYAQTAFQGDSAKAYLDRLCEPQFQGRKTGLIHARKAAEWIASRFEAWGLKPAGDAGSYIQSYPMLVTDQKKPAELLLKNGLFGPVKYQQGSDYTVYFNSGSGDAEAEVVFAGFGISEPEKGWDDFKGIDVSGKILFIYRKTPQDGRDWTAENERDYKIRTAAAHGAKALLMLEDRDWAIRGGTIHQEGYDEHMPAIAISKKTARDLFRATLRDMDRTLEDLLKTPHSFATGKIVRLRLSMKRIEPGVGENVVALLEGSDPMLRDEFVVIGGHMDHLGMDPEGRIYAGADDNASGTSVVMELARSLSLGPKPKRTIVFVVFGGEEQGLLGSKFFAENPTVPAEKICAMLNFDMEGMGTGGAAFGGRNYFPGLIAELEQNLPPDLRQKVRISRGWGMGGSDHAHFIQQGIPSFGFFSTGGHPFYHILEDVPETINVQSLQTVGDAATHLLRTLADVPTSLLFQGDRAGRCFLLLGDQMGFDLEDLQKEGAASVRAREAENGLRSVTVSLLNGRKPQEDPSVYYQALAEWEDWIRDQGMLLYKQGALDRAAGAGKIAVALAINAGEIPDVRTLRYLARLGVSFISVPDASSLLREGNLSEQAREWLKIAEEEKLGLIWNDENPERTAAVLSDHKGIVVLRRSAESLFDDSSLDPLLIKGRIVLSAGVDENTSMEKISLLLDRIGTRKIHLDMNLQGPAGNLWQYKAAQKLYGLRLTGGKQKAYDDLVLVLGGALKRLLQE